MTLAVLLLIAGLYLPEARAQAAAPTPPAAATSTATVSASTAAATGAGASTTTAQAPAQPPEAPEPEAPPEKPQPPPRRPSAKIGREAARWKPVPVRKTGEADMINDSFVHHVRRVRIKDDTPAPAEGEPPAEPPKPSYEYKGSHSRFKAEARSYKAGPSRLLVIALYPEAVKASRMHVELRYKVEAGALKRVEIAAVWLRAQTSDAKEPQRDSMTLRREGVEFEEVSPAGAQVFVAHLDAQPGGAAAFNAGRVKAADFGIRELKTVNLSYAVAGVKEGSPAPPRKGAAKAAPARPRAKRR
ncbi:MAG: hypothetical protein HY927_11990 [Elusimicrobia bacterium]|nr:hypothetical protein [Elusimicrobiota bacterium]